MEYCMYRMWCGIISTKHLNSTLIEKCIEILPKLTDRHKNHICSSLSWNPALTIDMVLAYPELKWKCDCYSSLNMNINDILRYPELNWNWNGVSENPSVTMDIVLSNIDKPWNWVYLSKHLNISMSDIESHMNLPWVWNWGGVNQNPNLTMTTIEANPDVEWEWNGISQNMKLTVGILQQYADKPWNCDIMSLHNPSITLELLTATTYLPWNYFYLSRNDCLAMDVVLALPDKNWNREGVCCSKNISVSQVESHMDLPSDWVWYVVSGNPNIRICDIEEHHDKTWDWDELGANAKLFNADYYIDQWLCKYSALSIHDEDYDRGEECLNYENVVDLVIQNEYCMSNILAYI